MKTQQTFTVYDLRFTIGKKPAGAVKPTASESRVPARRGNTGLESPAHPQAGKPAPRRGGAGGCNRQSSIVNRQSQEGIALVITLIMLSVTLVMAVAFLALAKRERGSVNTGTDSTIAQQAARAAVDQAEGQIVANILSGFSGLDSTNAYNLQLFVSTNYVNYTYGFQPNIANPTNVDYFDANGNLLTGNNFLLNVSNQYFLPRAPVFIPSTTSPLTYDFRYYLDLNENGRYDQYGAVPEILPGGLYLHPDGTEDNSPVNVVTNLAPGGDPEWIGVLEHPDAPHGPNNHFIARYAFIAVPAGNAMDINYIDNQALNTQLEPNNDGYMRNQGVGSWELNLAAFLADVNTNIWSPVPLPANLYYAYNRPYNNNSTPNSGYAFQDAFSLLKYRYNSNSLPHANAALGDTTAYANRMLAVNGIDSYSAGPLQTTLDYNRSSWLPPINASLPWSGANNTNHFFTPGDLLDGSKSGAGPNTFTNRLRQAGSAADTYDRYTYYRMLSQLGTDSSPDDGRLNLNYSNAVVSYKNINGVNVVTNVGIVAGAETNLVPWTPQNFFNAAADRLLRTYTANWFQSSPTNYLTTYYGYIPRGHVDATGLGVTNFPSFGQTNQIPTFGITNIPVWVNGVFVYSPAVNRLLQLAANLYDATTNGPYINGKFWNLPHVFRPIFEHDNFGNLFIVGYTNLNSGNGPNTVSGLNDPQLAPPYTPQQLTNFLSALTPIVRSGGNGFGPGLVNVYGVPWIIGAKKGLPNFNQFSMVTAAQVTRQLEVTRTSLDTKTAVYGTNQTYIVGISNSLGVSFWNSYSNAYYPHSGALTVFAADYSTMLLTNGLHWWPVSNYYATTFVTNSWPGSRWSGTPPAVTPQVTLQNNPFIAFNWWYLFQSQLPYDFGTALFDYNAWWQPTTPRLPQLPQFGLLVTNYLQAYILDGNNVIDYVQLRDPVSQGGLNQALADPDYATGNNNYYQWSTNVYPSSPPTPWGVINQLTVSANPAKAPAAGGQWSTAPTPMGISTPAAEAAYFSGFFTPTFQYLGKIYANHQLVIQAPYTPSRSVYSSYLLQANDPLVHYLSSDMNSQYGSVAMWNNSVQAYNGVWTHSDNLSANPMPSPPTSPLGGRYQPWGRSGQLASVPATDGNVYNLAYKDPLAWGSDYWDFPTNLYPTVGWIGRVHRGTPWQTVDLKSTNILWFARPVGQAWQPTGSNTWAAWTGDIAQAYFGQQYYDAANSGPMQDRLLFDVFTARLNDNAARGTLPVNQTQLASWSALLSGIVVLTNYTPVAKGTQIDPVYNNLMISPAGVDAASSALSNIVANIYTTRTNGNVFPYHAFTHAGDVLQSPALSELSPFLNQSTLLNQHYGISDEMYEWLPQQIMGLVRATEPRYVVYCYGQALRPAPGGTVLSGPFFQLVTNYQVVAESAVRAVIRVDNANTSQPHAVVESYNVLPPY